MHAILFLIFCAIYFKIDFTIWYLIGCLISFSLPDLDLKGTKASRKHPILSKLVRTTCTHRGFTHTILATLIVFLIFYSIELILPLKNIAFGVLIGYISHLLADMSTPRGLKLFWPLSNITIRIPILSNYRTLSGALWVIFFVYFIFKDNNLINLIRNIF